MSYTQRWSLELIYISYIGCILLNDCCLVRKDLWVQNAVAWYCLALMIPYIHTHMYTHTYIYIYIYIYTCDMIHITQLIWKICMINFADFKRLTSKQWLYVLVMSHTSFRVNPHSIIAWMSSNSLLEAGASFRLVFHNITCKWTFISVSALAQYLSLFNLL